MSLANSFSETVRDSLAHSSGLPSVLPVEAWREGRRATSARRTRTATVVARGVSVGLELAFFLGVGGMMAAGALLLR